MTYDTDLDAALTLQLAEHEAERQLALDINEVLRALPAYGGEGDLTQAQRDTMGW